MHSQNTRGEMMKKACCWNILIFLIILIPFICRAETAIERHIQGTLIDANSVVFDPNSAADTQKTITIAEPANSYREYAFIFYNPSTVSDLTVKAVSIETSLGGDTRQELVKTFDVPKSQTISGTTVNTYVKHVNGIFNGTNCQLIFSNDTATGAGEGFEPYFRVRVVK